jgi:murein DD-endopeptidase MepM/ murein hydrolase activator NlpD
MRFLAESRARLSARVAVLALVAATAAGCSTDINRFSDNPFSSFRTTNSAADDATGAVPRGQVEAQSLAAPTRPANISSTGAPGGASAGASSSRVAAAQVPVRPNATSRGAANRTAAAPRGIHVVAPGQSLTSIARLYGKSSAEVARANDIKPSATVRFGQRLTIPGVRQSDIKTSQASMREPAAPTSAAPAKPAAGSQVAANQPVATARLATPATETPQPRAASGTAELTGTVPSFRWPVRGRVIAGFGTKVNGAVNDGINLAVPEGTSVKAAEDGVVAYVGNELKGYGNLVLVRHSNGFVTAYAHASEIKVKRGDQVKRGQILALAGQTGNVSSPQLHFEIRKGSTPIDPTQYLNGN